MMTEDQKHKFKNSIIIPGVTLFILLLCEVRFSGKEIHIIPLAVIIIGWVVFCYIAALNDHES